MTAQSSSADDVFTLRRVCVKKRPGKGALNMRRRRNIGCLYQVKGRSETGDQDLIAKTIVTSQLRRGRQLCFAPRPEGARRGGDAS